jgi:aryl-alcohol dehydrogenase-like predicted oxidoreductase
MITLQDCVAMCDLDEAEVLAIAEHEHIPEIAAAALAQYLLSRKHGAETICDMLRDDIRAAPRRNDRDHAHELLMALRHFLSTHPEAVAR